MTVLRNVHPPHHQVDREKAVKTIKHAPMPRNRGARVLLQVQAFDFRFDEIAPKSNEIQNNNGQETQGWHAAFAV